jgi:hypothetical protein
MADLYFADGTHLKGGVQLPYINGGRGWLDAGWVSIRGDDLAFRTPSLAGVLTYRPRWPAPVLSQPFLEQHGHQLRWAIECPDADVGGRISWRGGALAVNGRGYRDRVWFDFLPWHFPLRRLEWGRAVAARQVATWVRAATPTDCVATNWVNGHVTLDLNDFPPLDVRLSGSEPFVDCDVVEALGLVPGPLRTVVHRLIGGIHETKLRAHCTLGDEEGVAVHELATWRARAR